MTDATWADPPAEPTPSRDEIQLWRADLDPPDDVLQDLAHALREDERVRANRLVFEIHRKRWIAARGILRKILGRYLGVAPQDVDFRVSRDGKPSLAEEFAASGIDFNLSHSEACAVYALSAGRTIGVDIEHVRSIEADSVATHFFAPGERQRLALVAPGPPKLAAFFACWTRKEAYIKAVGKGLGIPLNSFEVSLDSEPRLLWNEDPAEVDRWRFEAFSPGPGYAGAIAAEGYGWRLVKWTCEPLLATR